TSKTYGVLQLLTEVLCGVFLPRSARIGPEFHIIHCGGVSIHPDSVIGDRVGLMHNVTIGTNMGPGVPPICNHVFIGCGASVLGGIPVGNGARIAANSLVITDVPEGAVAVGVPAKMIHGALDLQSKAEKRSPRRSPLSLRCPADAGAATHQHPAPTC